MRNWSEKAHGGTGMHEAGTASCLITTLYDVIAAIQDGLSRDDDALVVATVVYLLRSGRLTWRGKTQVRPGLSERAAMEAISCGSSRTTAKTSSSTGQREGCVP